MHSPTVTTQNLRSPGVPLIETAEYNPFNIEQVTVDALELAARIIQAVPDGRPKASYVSSIRAFINGRYPEATATPPTDLLHPIVSLAQELLSDTYIPEKNCRCHISPPCHDCIEYSSLREVTSELHEAIKQYKGY